MENFVITILVWFGFGGLSEYMHTTWNKYDMTYEEYKFAQLEFGEHVYAIILWPIKLFFTVYDWI